MSCPGLFYRADVGQYRTKRGFMLRSHLRFLKSWSCPGCIECFEIRRRLALRFRITNPEVVRAGEVYRLRLPDEYGSHICEGADHTRATKGGAK